MYGRDGMMYGADGLMYGLPGTDVRGLLTYPQIHPQTYPQP